jgi:hypothetical protein
MTAGGENIVSILGLVCHLTLSCKTSEKPMMVLSGVRETRVVSVSGFDLPLLSSIARKS